MDKIRKKEEKKLKLGLCISLNCSNNVIPNTEYCLDHKCISNDCLDKKVFSKNHCSIHNNVCLLFSCKNQKIHTYCEDHQCIGYNLEYKACTEIIKSNRYNFKVCHFHYKTVSSIYSDIYTLKTKFYHLKNNPLLTHLENEFFILTNKECSKKQIDNVNIEIEKMSKHIKNCIICKSFGCNGCFGDN